MEWMSFLHQPIDMFCDTEGIVYRLHTYELYKFTKHTTINQSSLYSEIGATHIIWVQFYVLCLMRRMKTDVWLVHFNTYLQVTDKFITLWWAETMEQSTHTIHPNNYTHDLYFVVVRYEPILSISFRVTSLALGQSYDCPNTREVTLKDMGK